jgi:hypothetical protein
VNEPSRTRTVLFWLGTAAALFAIVWLVWPRGETESAKPHESAPDEQPAARARPQEPLAMPNTPPSPAAPRPEAAPTQPAAATVQPAEPVRVSALRAALEREAPDDTAQQAEERIRAIFAAEDASGAVFRHVLCTRSVCRIDLRWSPELHEPYNAGLIKVVNEFTTEISFEPDQKVGGPQMPVPMNIYVARPGHSTESLLAEESGR